MIQNSLKNFLIRKGLHLLFGIICIVLILWLPQGARYLLSAGAILSIILDLMRRREGKWQRLFHKTFGHMLKPSESKGMITGATTFLLTVSALPFFFNQDVVVVSIWVLSISDPLASIAGMFYPVKKIRREKSLTGSAVFFLSCLVILLFFIPESIVYLLITALLTTLVELLAPEVIENIAIGFSLAFIIASII